MVVKDPYRAYNAPRDDERPEMRIVVTKIGIVEAILVTLVCYALVALIGGALAIATSGWGISK